MDLEGAPIQISEESRHSLAGMLADWDAKAPPWRAKEMSDETESPVEALGYVED